MPKEWGGTNAKSVAARQRKNIAATEKREQELKRKEDESWKDEVTNAKLSKQAQLAAKLQEKNERKAENKRLAEEEAKSITKAGGRKTQMVPKMTRAEIEKAAEVAAQAAAASAAERDHKAVKEVDLPIENPNRVVAEERGKAQQEGLELIAASGIDNLVTVLDATPLAADRKPEKRLKAAFSAYEEEWLEKLKAEFPSLKRSQLQQRIFKQWQKAPENPLNQAAAAASSDLAQPL